MKLLLITSDFPFGNKGDNNFVKNEIKFYEKEFEKITILSTCSEKNMSYDIPQNAEAQLCDISKIKIFPLIKSLGKLCSKKTLDEIKYAKNELLQKSTLSIMKSIFKYYYCYQMLLKTIKKIVDDDTVCMSYWLSSRAYALAMLKEKKVLKGDCFSRSHGFDCFLSRGYLPFRREIDKNMKEIFFVSETGYEDYKKNILTTIKHQKSKYSVSRLGIDVKSVFCSLDVLDDEEDGGVCNFQNNKHWNENKISIFNNNENINEDNEIIFQSSKSLKIVSCSSVIAVKRIDLLIDALSAINDVHIEWTHFGDGELLQEMKGYAEKKLGNKVNIVYKFFGYIQNLELQKYYLNNRVDLFVNVSDSEGIPVSIMEANYFSIPAIGRNVGGMKEIIIKEFLLDDGDVATEIVKKLNYYNELTLEKKVFLRKKVFEIVKNDFDIAKNVKEMLAKITR